MFQANHRELHFSMVDGDFKKFEGKWSLKSETRYNIFLFMFVFYFYQTQQSFLS